MHNHHRNITCETYQTASNTIATLHTVHTSLAAFHSQFSSWRCPTKMRQHLKERLVSSRFMNAFTETSVAHVDCQLVAINALGGFRLSYSDLFVPQKSGCVASRRKAWFDWAYNNRENKSSRVDQATIHIAVPDGGSWYVDSSLSLGRKRPIVKRTWWSAASKCLNNLFNVTNRFGYGHCVNVWCNSDCGDWTNNRGQCFDNGLHHVI